MALKNFLGFGSQDSEAKQVTAEEAVAAVVKTNDTTTVRRIITELGQMPIETRRYLAGLAYVLSRAAHADLDITADESQAMEKVLIEVGGLPEAQAVLVVEIAKNQAELYSGTEDFLVTREFASRVTDEEKLSAIEACFAVVATDHEITSTEYAELTQIADELGLNRTELNVIRNKYKDSFTAIKAMRQQTQAASADDSVEAVGE
jgi:uncharacterized tellurite resistance protein B-like protein